MLPMAEALAPIDVSRSVPNAVSASAPATKSVM